MTYPKLYLSSKCPIFLILCLINVSVYTSEFLHCGGQCDFSIQNNACTQTVNIGIVQCNPTFTGIADGCKSAPIKTKYCASCLLRGAVCPYGCLYDVIRSKCVSSNPNIVCEPLSDQWKCPSGCIFNSLDIRCTMPNSIAPCGIPDTSKNPPTCPTLCTWNYQLNKCKSNDPNYVCELSKGLVCPQVCKLDSIGNKCIPTSTTPPFPNYPCNYTSVPLCAPKCSFNTTKNRCMPDAIYTNSLDGIITYTIPDCEPMIRLTCQGGPYDYILNYTAPTCIKDNTDDICTINGITQYPERLSSKYNSITCKYKKDLDCSVILGQITYCPQGCSIDPVNSKCVPGINTILCGSLGLINPTGTTVLTCPSKYKLLNISTNAGSKVNKCGPIWYYD